MLAYGNLHQSQRAMLEVNESGHYSRGLVHSVPTEALLQDPKSRLLGLNAGATPFAPGPFNNRGNGVMNQGYNGRVFDGVVPSSNQVLQKQSQTSEVLVPCVSTEGSFSVSIPRSWNRMDLSPEQTIFISSRGDPAQFCENLSVVTENAHDYNLKDYTSAAMIQVGKDVQNRILYSSETTLSGIRAHEVVYSSTHNGSPVIFRQIWLLFTVRNVTRAYVVSLSCDAQKYQALHPIIQQMLDSFRVLRLAQA